MSYYEVHEWIEGHRDEIIDFVLDFGNTFSPRGHESEASEFLFKWFQDWGIETEKQLVVEGRNNVIGRIPGEDQSGDSLLFNGHLDSALGNEVEDEWIVPHHHPVYYDAWREGDFLFGDDVTNDKAPMATFLWAALAIQQSGVNLSNDLLLTGTVGEIGGATIDEYQDTKYLGTGLGTRRLVESGKIGDYAIVAESTDFAITHMECGVAWFKITVTGLTKYQPFIALDKSESVEEDHPGALPDAARAVLEIERWAQEYQANNTTEYDHGTMQPTAGVGAIRSGNPTAPAQSPGKAALYVDVRLPPKKGPEFVSNDLAAVLENANIDAEVETYMYRRGYKQSPEKVSPLVDTYNESYRQVKKETPPEPDPASTSMWRDFNVFAEVGVPTVMFGPPRVSPNGDDYPLGNPAMHVDDIIAATKINALVAMSICNTTDLN